MAAEVDELYTVKNSFYMGQFRAAIDEARALRVKAEALRIERDCYIYRSMIGLRQFKAVADEIPADAPAPLKGVKLLAQYLGAVAAGGAGKDRLLLDLEDCMADDVLSADATFQLAAGTVYLHEENYAAGLKAVRAAATAEQLALTVQLYLRLDRPDLAEKTVKALQTLDDESPLAQLSAGWLCLAQGGDRYKEASLLFRDLVDRHGPAVSSLTGLAAAFLALKKHEDAERTVKEALALAPGDPDALVNAITLFSQLGRTALVTSKLLPELREAAPHHPYLQSMAVAEGAFDRVAAMFA